MTQQSHSWAYTQRKTVKDTCAPEFTAALFTTARTRKQPKCPSASEWIYLPSSTQVGVEVPVCEHSFV